MNDLHSVKNEQTAETRLPWQPLNGSFDVIAAVEGARRTHVEVVQTRLPLIDTCQVVLGHALLVHLARRFSVED